MQTLRIVPLRLWQASPAGSPPRPTAPRLTVRGLSGLLLPLATLAAWQAGSWLHWINPIVLPAPAAVLRVLASLFASGELFDHLGISLGRVMAGFSYGVLTAIALGTLTGFSRLGRRLIDPSVHALRTVPGLAWIPMFILWFGIDEGSKIGLIALASFFPTYLNVMAGIKGADLRLIEAGRVCGLRGRGLIWHVLLPGCLPFLMVGLRQSMGVAWLVVVGAELMGASSGVGYLLMDGEMTGRPQIVIACMIIFALSGKTTDWAIVRLSRPLLQWQDTLDQE